MRQSFLILILLGLATWLNVAAQTRARGTLVTQLPLTLQVTKIQIKNDRDLDDDGEFHFWRKMAGENVRLPEQGEIVRKKNDAIYPTDPNLASEPFWKISWQETGTRSRLIEFDGWEYDSWPDEDDYLGIVRTTLDLSTFEFVAKNANRKLETDDFQLIFNLTCAPLVISTSHPDTTTVYEKAVLNLNWSPIMPAIGILGYSYRIDENPATSPDAPLNGTHTTTDFFLTPSSDSHTYWFHVRARDKAGFWSSTTHLKVNTGYFRLIETTGISQPGPVRPEPDLSLRAFPNPFNAQTQISYKLTQPGAVEILIFNVKGQLVRDLVRQEHGPGTYQLNWDARNDAGAVLPTGIYLVVLGVGKEFLTQKITLIR